MLQLSIQPITNGGDMAHSLYQISIPTYLQALGGVQTYLKKGLEHCADNGVDPQSLV
jgi:hypothetical protein